MWECQNCKEKIEDRYKHCWSCGASKPGAEEDAAPVRIHLKDESPPAEEFRAENEPPPVEEIPPIEETAPIKETPPVAEIPRNEHVPFEDSFPFEERAPSRIGKIVPLFLWLAAVAGVAAFAYYSQQKTKDFENRLRENAANLNSQAKQFVFSKDAPREKKGTLKAKVLPLSTQNNEVDGLYNYLPDDLRPASLEEVKTILWLDCKPSEAGRYEDGSMSYRDKCNAYLVDRNTSKVIQVQDFSGEPPPLKKQWGTGYASGKVLPEAYISYIRENQAETERAPFAFASDSPEHHLWFKSELLYAGILLVVLAAIGFGWLVFKIKSLLWRSE